ncbi:MAG TPA: BTAD domain-containing putative transcriptional regulator [Tissierellaceae bacterium]|nr:BTAD domain-containing putative transcriptional regulator [Tissierellaceae bacterium]
MVEIYTLGNFDIRLEDVSILKAVGNKQRLVKLFKYLLTFHGKKLLPERIIEDLWQDEYTQPLRALRTQISRVRRMFPEEMWVSAAFFSIEYIDGYYVFNLHKDCHVDFIQMQRCIDEVDCDGGYRDCEEIVHLYKGEYLGELGDEEWLVPVRNMFDRMYIKSLSKYLQHLMDRGEYSKILTICEEAMRYKPYEESLHIFFMEALDALGETRYAINHYSFCTTKLYRELGETPSDRMKDVYRRIKNGNGSNNNHKPMLQLNNIDCNINNSIDRIGALVCDTRQFEFIYGFEKLQMEREKMDLYLGILTLDQSGLVRNGEIDVEKSTKDFIGSIQYNLRKGDVISQWNPNQALMLYKMDDECGANCLMDRIQKSFSRFDGSNKLSLNIKIKKIV